MIQVKYVFSLIFAFLLFLVVPVQAEAMNMDITHSYRDVSYGKRVDITLSLSNPVGTEIGVSSVVYYADGTKGAGMYYCQPDTPTCPKDYSMSYAVESDSPAYKAVTKIDYFIEYQGGSKSFFKTLTLDGTETDPGSGGGDPDPPGGGGEDPGPDPGDGGGDPPGSGGDCPACELLACPGWDDIAKLFAKEIGKKIPPPPDWEEVAEIFGDELVPRMSQEITDEFIDRFVPAMGDEMSDVLKEVLGYPDQAVNPIIVPDVESMEMDGTSGVSVPGATDSTPPAQSYTFDTVPDIPVNPDRTGGIDLSRADPIDSLPHSAPGYKPTPGRETGGTKPQTKPIETPIPNGTSPPAPIPNPGGSTPGTGTGIPTPGASITPSPRPEMPMPQ